jgi:hypothetical protein
MGFIGGPNRLNALSVSEQFADGLADRATLEASLVPVSQLVEPIPLDAEMAQSVFGQIDIDRELSLVQILLSMGPGLNAEHLAIRAVGVVAPQNAAGEMRQQAHILRDIFGNPIRLAATGPGWRVVNGSSTANLARALYDERSFDRLPMLADALEDAGCTDAELLGHLRGPGPHVRGCWAVDLVLGRS